MTTTTVTLRDQIALKMLEALTPIYWDDFELYGSGKELVKCQVESAYEYADEMIRQGALSCLV